MFLLYLEMVSGNIWWIPGQASIFFIFQCRLLEKFWFLCIAVLGRLQLYTGKKRGLNRFSPVKSIIEIFKNKYLIRSIYQ